MLIVIDNAESILDHKGENAEEIGSVVDDLCQSENLCICITSRNKTVPSCCIRPEIPTLSMEAARRFFHHIYQNGEQSSIFDDLLKSLDFHALSIQLLATTAFRNEWDYDRLAKEWEKKRAEALEGDNKIFTRIIGLSLSSPTFLSLGSNARDLLGVVAFFPQGVNEKHLDWLFPSILNSQTIFDGFCRLSLTNRSNGFITMLAPIRDYLGPRDPRLSPLLCATRDQYFNRLMVSIAPTKPGFEESRWVVLEDVNVEYLLDIFTSIDPDRDDIWGACYYFILHLRWHKPRPTMLKSKIEALPDNHHDKPRCLTELSRLFGSVGNHSEQKRILAHTLELRRRLGDSRGVAYTLQQLSDVNRNLELYEEGIGQAKEALEIFEQIGDTKWQMQCSTNLAWLFRGANQLDAAEDAASRGIDLAPEKGLEFLVCGLHRTLGRIFVSKGEKAKAIHHYETAIGIGSSFHWHGVLFWTHYDLADMFLKGHEFDDANAHTEQAKPHAVNDAYKLGFLTHMQSIIWYGQRRFEEAKSEVLHALQIFEKLGAERDAGICREFLQTIEQAIGKLLDAIPHPTSVNLHFLLA
jgi:tetratricopeptide (TPR) repeat protein